MADPSNTFVLKAHGAQLTLSVRENDSKAFLEIVKDKDSDFELTDLEKFEDEVCEWLEKVIPEKLIETKILKSSLDQYKTSLVAKERRIAQGLDQTPGIDGKFVLLVKPFNKVFEGTYDFKNRFQKHFDVIHTGSPIARIYPPKPGIDGYNVYNKTVPYIPGKPVQIELGDFLSLVKSESHSYQEIIANENGFISQNKIVNGFKLALETTLKFPNGIDHRSGSVNFVGSVEVSGDVKEGFIVEASKDIKISGNVTSSKIVSQNGDISISGVVIDGDASLDGLINFLEHEAESHTTISCGQSFKAKSLQNASVFARGNIEIESSIIRSHVFSSGIVFCKGSVYASKISAACGIDVKKLGNENGVKTIIQFLHPVEAGIEFQTLKNNYDRQLERKNKLELFIGPFLSNPKGISKLSPAHTSKMKDALTSLKHLLENIENLKVKMSELRGSNVELKSSQLNVSSECFPGVEIWANNSKFLIDEKKIRAFSLEYDWLSNDFKFVDYQPIKCETKNNN